MSLVSQTVHSGLMSHFDNSLDITTNSIIGRVIHQYRYRIRVLVYSLRNLLSLHSQGYPQPVIDLRIYIHRNRTAKYQGIDDASMDIPGQNDFISPLTGRKDHTLHRAGGSPYH